MIFPQKSGSEAVINHQFRASEPLRFRRTRNSKTSSSLQNINANRNAAVQGHSDREEASRFLSSG